MAVTYDAETCRVLERAFEATGVARPMRVGRCDAGQELTYRVTGVAPAVEATVRLVVDKFVGGGFAGQVYRVKIAAIEGEPIEGLEVGGTYAMKILIPPSSRSVRFRNLIYWLGFQGPFSLQVNPDAARAGALWQKFIRRAAKDEFGTERAVVDILATFVDERMGSCGELSEWLEGRNWNFEVDNRLEARRRWRVGDPIDMPGVGAPEYRAKKAFMARMVRLFHRIGAAELARQYEWWTCKSQPNCLKRLDSEGDPEAGLTAVDFRAGLALLAWLPMSPGDVKLILTGLLKRGALVQFDRGDIAKLEAFIAERPDTFADMGDTLAELKRREDAYRNSLIDITHNHVRLLTSRRLWSGIFEAGRTSWRIRNLTDDVASEKLRGSTIKTGLFAMLGMPIGLASAAKAVGLLGLLAVGIGAIFGWRGETAATFATIAACVFAGGIVLSILARLTRALWGRADLRRHYLKLLASPAYLLRAARAHAIEQIIEWRRAGRISAERARRVKGSLLHYAANLPLSVLPAGLHRFLADRRYAWAKLKYIVARPLKLYFNAEVREQWMRDMLDDGLAHGMVSRDEAEMIRRQLSEPFIQKYLKSLAVHVCTLPVTQIVSVIVAICYWDTADSWAANWARAGLILAAFQITPISPGSLVRGLYVVGMAIKDRNYRDYKVAVWMGFWKYIGYLSFPIQMAYHYPAIARFMAGRWATGAVHILPVFGERGALAEHAVFDLFYNRPLTLRKRMEARAKTRQQLQPRRWHMPLCAIAAWLVVARYPALVDLVMGRTSPAAVTNGLTVLAATVGGLLTALFARGATTGSRIVMGAVCGLMVAVFSGVLLAAPGTTEVSAAVKATLKPAFFSTLTGLAGALLVEMNPSPLPAD